MCVSVAYTYVTNGMAAAMAWIDFLGDDVSKISSVGCFWALLRKNRASMASALVKKWLPIVRHTAVGHRDTLITVLIRLLFLILAAHRGGAAAGARKPGCPEKF